MEIPIEEDNSAETIVRLVAATIGFGGKRLEDLIAKLNEEFLFDADVLMYVEAGQWSNMKAPIGLVAALKKSFEKEAGEKQPEENNIKRALRRDSQARLERRLRGRQMSSCSFRHIVMEDEEDEDENIDHQAFTEDRICGDYDDDNDENIMIDGGKPPRASCYNPPMRLVRRLKPSKMCSRTNLEYEHAPPDQRKGSGTEESDEDQLPMPTSEIPPSNSRFSQLFFYFRHFDPADLFGIHRVNRMEWKGPILKDRNAWEVKQYTLNATELCFLLTTLFAGVLVGVWEVFPEVPENSDSLPESFYILALVFHLMISLGVACAIAALCIYGHIYVASCGVGLSNFKKFFEYSVDLWHLADHCMHVAIKLIVPILVLCTHCNLLIIVDRSNGVLAFVPSLATAGFAIISGSLYAAVVYQDNLQTLLALHGGMLTPGKETGADVIKSFVDISDTGPTLDTMGRRRSSFSTFAAV